MRDSLGVDVTQLLDEHVALERQYVAVTATPEGCLGGTLPDLETADDELRHSTRVVCRLLREAPGIVTQLQAARATEAGGGEAIVSETMSRFLSALHALQEQAGARLSTTVEEDKEGRETFEEVKARDEKAGQQVKQLQKELRAERASREADVSSRDAVLRKLRATLDTITNTAADEVKAIEEEGKAQEQADHATGAEREAALRAELARLKGELGSRRKEHRESEEALRKKKARCEGEVEQWIAKYDAEVGERYEELKALKAIYAEETAQLAELEAHFARLAAEREAELEAERRVAEELARQQAQERALHDGAARIQAVFRGKTERRLLEKRKAGKGGKGKKK